MSQQVLYNGTYKIFNSQFTTQYVDLPYGNAYGEVVSNNNQTEPVLQYPDSIVWDLANVGDGEFKICNTASSAAEGPCAFAELLFRNSYKPRNGSGVFTNSSDDATIWTLKPTDLSDQYQITVEGQDQNNNDILLFWTLGSDYNGTQITIEGARMDQKDSQLWFFNSDVTTGGNAARGLNGLD